MAATPASKSAAIRARLNHPVIDSDGHTVEFLPAVLDYWYRLSPEERRERRATRPPW